MLLQSNFVLHRGMGHAREGLMFVEGEVGCLE